ncbi:hypothetical protein C1X64_27225 [Pseudomonas sp. GW456-E7]|nr:hypothetical protein C1X64_27225 [Pseudomonas sp. GW456-E7]
MRNIVRQDYAPVGASLLAKNARTPWGIRFYALSLTSIASRLAPTPFLVSSDVGLRGPQT